MDCSKRISRDDLQNELSALNPNLSIQPQAYRPRPDGDTEVPEAFVRAFKIPSCQSCGGDLKPEVVFFGDRVPPDIVSTAFEALEAADALLVIGSSLKIFSGYRFCRQAHERDQPIMIINPGWTRGDPQASLKIEESAEVFLPRLVERLANER
jgi:NAD-dependent SIR2 family protein deacetylase